MSKFRVIFELDLAEVRSMPSDVLRAKLTKMLYVAIPKAMNALVDIQLGKLDSPTGVIDVIQTEEDI